MGSLHAQLMLPLLTKGIYNYLKHFDEGLIQGWQYSNIIFLSFCIVVTY